MTRIDTIAQALHAECEQRWEGLAADPMWQGTMHGPDAHRATAERIDAALGPETRLYVVTTGLPGPDPASCGFVELEDDTGASRRVAEWHPHPTAPGLYRLGPFAALGPDEGRLREALRWVVDAKGQGDETWHDFVGRLKRHAEAALADKPR